MTWKKKPESKINATEISIIFKSKAGVTLINELPNNVIRDVVKNIEKGTLRKMKKFEETG